MMRQTQELHRPVSSGGELTVPFITPAGDTGPETLGTELCEFHYIFLLFCEIGTYSKYRSDSFELSSDFTFNFFATMFRSALKSVFYVNLMCCSVAQTLSRCRSCALPAAFRQV